MNFLQAFLKGWLLVVRFPVYCLLKYGLTLIFTFLLLNPLLAVLQPYLANRTALVDQAQQPSLAFVSEFIDHLDTRLPEMVQSGTLLLVLFVVLNVFLTAGILNAFAQHLRKEKVAFMDGVRRHFLPLALFVLIYGAILVFGNQGWQQAKAFILGRYPAVWLEVMVAVVQLWLVWLAWLVYDMTRVIICATPRDSSGRSLAMLLDLIRPLAALPRALFFVFSKPSLWLVSLAFLLIQAFWLVGIQRGWFTASGVGILLLGQLVILARTATTMAYWGAETTLWVTNQQPASSAASSESVFEPAYSEPELVEPDVVSQAEALPEETASDHGAPLDDTAEPFDEDDAYLRAGRGTSNASSESESSQGSGNAAT